MSRRPKIARLTHHAADRGKERAGLSAKALERTAQKALEHGLHREDTRGQLRQWMENKEGTNADTSIRIYGQFVYVFGIGDALVTVLELPHEFRRSAQSALLRSIHKHPPSRGND